MNVKINSYTTTSESYSNEEYGAWHVDHENSIYSLSITKTKNNFDLIIEDDFDTTKPCYLVYAEYSTGDSFGCRTGNLEYIKLFKTKYEADIFVKDLQLLEKYSDSNFKKIEFKPKLIDNIDEKCFYNRKFEYFGDKFCLPWGGYFDNLDLIEIIELNFVPLNKQ